MTQLVCAINFGLVVTEFSYMHIDWQYVPVPSIYLFAWVNVMDDGDMKYASKLPNVLYHCTIGTLLVLYWGSMSIPSMEWSLDYVCRLLDWYCRCMHSIPWSTWLWHQCGSTCNFVKCTFVNLTQPPSIKYVWKHLVWKIVEALVHVYIRWSYVSENIKPSNMLSYCWTSTILGAIARKMFFLGRQETP